MSRQRLDELNKIVTEASEAYYAGVPTMSDKEFDELVEELKVLEDSFNIENRTSEQVGAAAVGNLPKSRHKKPMLSLDKTKDVALLVSRFKKGVAESKEKGFNNPNVVLMWKLDGSTLVLTYEDGKLVRAVTRGDGNIGSDITHNARYINGIPSDVGAGISLTVRGEAVMSYDRFNRINDRMPASEQYKNPRNLATATISMLEMDEVRRNTVDFVLFDIIDCSEALPDSFSDRLRLAEGYGFDVVKNVSDTVDALEDNIVAWTDDAQNGRCPYPVDGLVVAMDALEFTSGLQGTGHNPHIMSGYALKWTDDTVETTLTDIEWSASRTGLLNPVAVFDAVELEGTTVTRASLHNVSYIIEKNLKIGDRITVYKANKIIPQIDKNLDQTAHAAVTAADFNMVCPVCGEPVKIVKADSGTAVMMCDNDSCGAKKLGSITHFVERDCMNVVGLSEQKLEFLISRGYIDGCLSLYSLKDKAGKLAGEDGWGAGSVKNLTDAIEASKSVDFVSLIHSFGIPNTGKGQAKLLKKAVEAYHKSKPIEDENHIRCLARMVYEEYDFTSIDGFGEVIASSITEWVRNALVRAWYGGTPTEEAAICELIVLTDAWADSSAPAISSGVSGKTFVITGSLNHFANRDMLIADIEAKGGKATGSVTKNTSYLINNDVTSTSGKNKKAKELGIPIISEDDYLNL